MEEKIISLLKTRMVTVLCVASETCYEQNGIFLIDGNGDRFECFTARNFENYFSEIWKLYFPFDSNDLTGLFVYRAFKVILTLTDSGVISKKMSLVALLKIMNDIGHCLQRS